MRLLGHRRVAQAVGVAAVAALALTGCSSGQIAETALKRSSVPGVNATTSDRSVGIRNLHIAYNGPEGYQSGASAPLEVSLYNQTAAPITVTISSRPLAGAAEQEGVITARQIGVTGSTPPGATGAAVSEAAPEPSGSRPPATPDTNSPDNVPSPSAEVAPEPSVTPAPGGSTAVQPARITLQPFGSEIFLASDPQQLLAVGLSDRLLPAQSVNLVFEFSNGAEPLELQAGVTVPLSPAPRGSAENEGIGEGEHGTE